MLITGRLPKACSRKQIFRRFYAILHLTVNFDHKYKHNLYHRYFDTKLGQATLLGKTFKLQEGVFYKVQGFFSLPNFFGFKWFIYKVQSEIYIRSPVYNFPSLTSSYSNILPFHGFSNNFEGFSDLILAITWLSY